MCARSRSRSALPAYVADCFARLEQRANADHRREVAGVEGRARVTIHVRSDGNVMDVVVREATGNAAVDPTARRILRLSEPCAVFPVAVQEKADYLHLQAALQIAGSSPGKVVTLMEERP